jgi:hypothetical protein
MPKHTTRTTVVTKEDGKESTSETVVEKSSIWDRATSVATVAGIIIALITAWKGILEYRHQAEQDRYARQHQVEQEAYSREMDAKARERESKKIFLDKQSELYFKVVNLVGEIAAKKSPTDKDRSDFDAMYLGPLPMVADEDVSQAVIIVERLLHEKPMERSISIDNGCLTDAALLLAHCVKRSLEKSWSVELGTPSEFPCDKSSFKDIHDSCGELR